MLSKVESPSKMIGLVLEPASPAAVTFRARERLRICNEGGASAAAVTLLDGDNIIGAEPSGEGHGIGLGIPTGTKVTFSWDWSPVVLVAPTPDLLIQQ